MPSLSHEGKEESLRGREQEQCMFVHAFWKQNLSLTLTPRSLAAEVGLYMYSEKDLTAAWC